MHTTLPFSSTLILKRMAPVHNIPKCDMSGMVVVVVVLSILWM